MNVFNKKSIRSKVVKFNIMLIKHQFKFNAVKSSQLILNKMKQIPRGYGDQHFLVASEIGMKFVMRLRKY